MFAEVRCDSREIRDSFSSFSAAIISRGRCLAVPPPSGSRVFACSRDTATIEGKCVTKRHWVAVESRADPNSDAAEIQLTDIIKSGFVDCSWW